MRIAVISDTHIPKRGRELPKALLDGIRGVDLILHAGDISRDYVIYELRELAPVEAVAGNTDDDYVQAMLPRQKIIQAENCRIGLVHGDGSGGTTRERARKAFAHERVQCIVFGHSHIPFNQVEDGILFFNPGSPTDKRRQPQFSYGLLEVEDTRIRGEIKYFSK